MSDSSAPLSPPPPPPPPDSGEALTRLAAYGKKERTSWGPLVLVAVLIIPLAAAGWVAWRQTELQRELATLRADNATLQQLSASSNNRFTEMEQRQQELEQAQRDQDAAIQATVQQALQQEQSASAAALEAQAEQITMLERELAETRQRLNTMDGGGASPLSEAEVLLRFAQQRLALARDTASAIELFRAADDALRNSADPAIVNVREVLARELASLQALPEIDVTGLFAQLSAQAARIEDFAVVSDATVQDFTVDAPAEEAPESGGWWDGIKQSLNDYFVVSREAGAAIPQLSTTEQFQLRALVQLHIEQAKLALLRMEPELYRAALEDALAASRRWLRSEDGGVEDLVDALTTLRDTPIVADIPAVNQALSALRRLTGESGNVQAEPPAQ